MISAPDAPRQRLKHASAAQGCGRTLLAEHERLAINGDDRFGQEELAELIVPRS
jgi:hypothetical protein